MISAFFSVVLGTCPRQVGGKYTTETKVRPVNKENGPSRLLQARNRIFQVVSEINVRSSEKF